MKKPLIKPYICFYIKMCVKIVSMKEEYQILLYYKYVDIENPEKERD
jgi:hypothetical protein